MKYLGVSITELHELLITGKVTPEELANEALLACKSDTNNAFEYICENEIKKQLEDLNSKDKNDLFWGIPFTAKDNFSTKDIPTCGSSNILNGYVPLFNATVIDKLLSKGAILIAKTTMDELAMGGSGTTGHLGMTYNPWDKSHTRLVGGSSCGSASNVSSGIVPFSLGSDTGDSVRKPASFAGLVGFKPTWGRISRYGLFPFAPSMDHVGFFTRNVEDSSSVLKAISGRDEHDMTSSTKDLVVDLNKPVKGMKVAVINGIINSISNHDVIDAFNKSIENLRNKGVTVDYVDMDENLLKAIFPTYFIISCAEATSNNANLDGIKFGNRQEGQSFEEVMINTRTKGFGEMIKRRFVIGSYSLLRDNQDELFFRAQKCRHLIVDAVNNILKDYDAIYAPAAPGIAPKKDAVSEDKLSNEYLIADNFMAIANFGGQPSLTLPIGFIEGMPFGGNLTGKIFDEESVLVLAKAIEEGTGYKNICAKEAK